MSINVRVYIAYSHIALEFPDRVRDNVSIVQRIETKRGQQWFPYVGSKWENQSGGPI